MRPGPVATQQLLQLRQAFLGCLLRRHVERLQTIIGIGEHMQHALAQRRGQRRVCDDDDAVHGLDYALAWGVFCPWMPVRALNLVLHKRSNRATVRF